MVELLKLVATVLTLLHFLGPWGSLALIGVMVAAFVAFYTHGDRLLGWFIHREVRAIGKVMKDATVTIHSVTPAAEPDPSVWRTGDDEEDDAFEKDLEASGMPDGDYEWFKVDATIQPQPDSEGTPAVWEPSMLQLTKNDGQSRHALEFDADCLIAQVERWEDGDFTVFDHGTVSGAARVRLYVGTTPGTHSVQLGYLGETLAPVRLTSRRRSFAV